MKKILLLAASLFQIIAYAQTVPNGDFETWNSTPYNDPTGWNTANLRDLQKTGNATITKVTGFSGFGIRIQTYATTDTSESYIINTNNPCNDPPQWTGGVPYTQQPTAITGYYRYNLPGNDTALFIVVFRKNGAHIGDNFIKIKGTGSQNTWAPFSFSLTCTGVPDTMIIAAASGNKKSNIPVQNGSFIELDNLAFSGATMAIPNGNFENWSSNSFDQVAGWAAWGDGVTKSTGSYAGTYALKLQTAASQCSNVNSSGVTTGHMTNNNGPAGGRPYSKQTDTLSGYYKYTSAGGDTAQFNITLMKNHNMIGGGFKKLPASANYIYFEVPIGAGQVPDSMRIDIQSSKWPTSQANIGSVLYIDNLSLRSAPLGIKLNQADNLFAVYPNPNNGTFEITCQSQSGDNPILNVFSQTGQLVLSQTINANGVKNQIDLTSCGKGLYLLKTEQRGQVITKRILVE